MGGMANTTKQNQSGVQTSESQGTSNSQVVVPDYLKPLAEKSANDMIQYQAQNPLQQYFAPNPMEVAPKNELQDWVSQNVKTTWDTPATRGQALDYVGKATDLAGQTATGAGIDTSPAVLRASEAFDKLMQPQIENQMGLAGLGKSSSLGNAMAMGKTTYMLPMVQDELAREQAAIQNQASMYGSMVPQLEGMGTNDTTRQLATLSGVATTGASDRAITQEPLTADYQDFLRRQALSEQAAFVPFGATASQSIGPQAQAQQTSSSGGTTKGSSVSGAFK